MIVIFFLVLASRFIESAFGQFLEGVEDGFSSNNNDGPITVDAGTVGEGATEGSPVDHSENKEDATVDAKNSPEDNDADGEPVAGVALQAVESEDKVEGLEFMEDADKDNSSGEEQEET